jgi:hypothetical protein
VASAPQSTQAESEVAGSEENRRHHSNWLSQCNCNCLPLRHCGTAALRHCGTAALRHCGTAAAIHAPVSVCCC